MGRAFVPAMPMLAAGPRLLAMLLGILAILGTVGLPTAARGALAEPSAERAQDLVRGLAGEVWRLLETDLDESARVQQLAQVLESKTDVDLLSRLVLGRYWHDLQADQRSGYQELFREVVMVNLAARLNRYARDASGALEQHFQITGSSPVGKGDVLVRSKITPQEGPPVDVDWRVRARDDQPVIIDLIVAGVSMLVSQRSEFAAVIERSNVDGLLDELRARAQNGASRPVESEAMLSNAAKRLE